MNYGLLYACAKDRQNGEYSNHFQFTILYHMNDGEQEVPELVDGKFPRAHLLWSIAGAAWKHSICGEPLCAENGVQQ